jgi:hypothetical protein
MRFAALCFVGLLACGGTSTGTGDDPEVIDHMRLTSPDIFFSPGDRYVIADFWEATNSTGQILPLVDTLGFAIERGLRYSLGDSMPSASHLVDSTGSVILPVFTGRLFIFAPTSRDARELMGGHYIAVQ